MANTIIPKRSSVAGKIPLTSDLQVGEIAVNLADGLIFTKNGADTVIQLGGGVKTFNTRSGDVVLTLSDVTGALTFTPINKAGDTMTGKLTLPTPTSSTASLNLPVATFANGPTAPVNGDVWINNSNGLNLRIDGVTVQAALTGTANTFTAAQTFSGNVTINGGTISMSSVGSGLVQIGTNITAGNIFIGGASQWGGITIGQSTDTHTLNIDSGATASGKTKTINIGGSGVSGSTTVINLGSSVSGASSTINAYGTWTYNGKIVLPAVTSSSAPINLGQAGPGIGPSAPSNGDLWVNQWGLFARYNGATQQFAAYAVSANWSALQSFDGGLTTSNLTASGANVYLGQSTGLSYAHLGTGATVSGQIKDVRIGTGGVSGSTTNIAIGSSVSGATTNVTANGTWTFSETLAANISGNAATVTSITGTQVTTALGYTPYDGATNPNGYISSASLGNFLTKDGGTLNANANLTFQNGKLTVPAWIDANSKLNASLNIGTVITAIELNPQDGDIFINASYDQGGLYYRMGGALHKTLRRVDTDELYQPINTNLSAIGAILPNDTGLLRKTGNGTWALDYNTYLTLASGDLLYQKKSDMSSYLTVSNAASTYLSIAGASSTYLTSAVAAATYQPTLVSGTSIKTLNTESLLGSGDITLKGVPVGGVTGQVLGKASNADYDLTWITPSAGGGGSGGGTAYAATTTNATVTTIATLPIATHKTVLVRATIVAKAQSADVGAWQIQAVARRDSVNVADVGSVYEEIIVRTNANLFVDIESDPTTNTIKVLVQGTATQTYTWQATVETFEV
jgi:hypothetical protein